MPLLAVCARLSNCVLSALFAHLRIITVWNKAKLFIHMRRHRQPRIIKKKTIQNCGYLCLLEWSINSVHLCNCAIMPFESATFNTRYHPCNLHCLCRIIPSHCFDHFWMHLKWTQTFAMITPFADVHWLNRNGNGILGERFYVTLSLALFGVFLELREMRAMKKRTSWVGHRIRDKCQCLHGRKENPCHCMSRCCVEVAETALFSAESTIIMMIWACFYVLTHDAEGTLFWPLHFV